MNGLNVYPTGLAAEAAKAIIEWVLAHYEELKKDRIEAYRQFRAWWAQARKGPKDTWDDVDPDAVGRLLAEIGSTDVRTAIQAVEELGKSEVPVSEKISLSCDVFDALDWVLQEEAGRRPPPREAKFKLMAAVTASTNAIVLSLRQPGQP